MNQQGPPYGSCQNVTVYMARTRPSASGKGHATVMSEVRVAEPTEAPARPNTLNFNPSQNASVAASTPSTVVAPINHNKPYEAYKKLLQHFRSTNNRFLFWDIAQLIVVSCFYVWSLTSNPTFIFISASITIFVFKVAMFFPISVVGAMLSRPERRVVFKGVEWIQKISLFRPLMTIVDTVILDVLFLSSGETYKLFVSLALSTLLLANAALQFYARHVYLRRTVTPLSKIIEQNPADISLGRATDYTISA